MLLNERLIARLRDYRLQPTGAREISDLQDVDTAFCNNLLRAFSDVVVTDDRRETRPFAEFLARAPSDQIKFGEFDDVAAFLAAYQSSESGRSQERGPGINSLALPVINVSRLIDFSLYQGDITREMPWCATLETKEDGPFAIVSKTHAEVSYTVTIISSEKHTLNRMCTTLATWISMLATHGITNFTARTRIARQEVELGAEFIDPKSIVFTNVSLPADQNRIYASQCSVPVVADILIAYSVEAIPTTIEFNTGVLSHG